jgi:predicted permease
MAFFRRLLQKLWASAAHEAADDELSREIRAHLTLLEDSYRQQGMNADDARFAARRAFGGRVEQAKDQHRDARSFRWLDDLRRDVAYSVRSLTRTPAFTAAALLTLSLGIGATTAVFTLFDSVLFKPLPVDRPQDLRVVRHAVLTGGRTEKASTIVPYGWFTELRTQPEVFSEILGFADLNDATLSYRGRERRLAGGGVFVSDNYFTLLGVGPRLGRTFSRGDASDRGVVLGYACWQREFGAASDVVGQQILINGVAFTINGVAPAAFFGLELGQVPDIFLPLETLGEAQPAIAALANRENWRVQIVGRLAPGTNDIAAGERLTTLRDFMTLPAGQAEHRLQLVPVETGLSDLRARLVRPLSIMLGMGAMLLLVACANVATLLGARAAARKQEIVIRAAIGAGRGRLLRQLITESVVLALAAGALGVVWGSWATRILPGLMSQESSPLRLDLPLDRRVLLFAAAISLVTALLAGVAPALRSLRLDLSLAMRDRSHGGAGTSRARPFAIVQVALSVILVVASTMLARTVINLSGVELGFEPEHLIQVTADPGARLLQGPTLEAFYRAAYERLRASPNVRSVTSTQFPLFERSKTTGSVAVPGVESLSEDERMVQFFQVGATFFETMGIRILRGRDFTDQDMTGAHKIVAINEAAARRFFGDNDPIGRTIRSGGVYEVAAVVRGAKYNTARDEELPVLFMPYTTVRQRTRITFVVRIADQTDDHMQSLGTAVRGDDPLIPISMTPMSTFVERSLAQERLLAVLSTAFAAAALLLLSIGLYGIMTFWVTERTAEIGIHLALGAGLTQVRWAVIRQPLWLAGAGIAFGLPVALVGSRVMAGLLFGVGPWDAVTIGVAVFTIVMVTIVACLPPAYRAARVDPMTALRCE